MEFQNWTAYITGELPAYDAKSHSFTMFVTKLSICSGEAHQTDNMKDLLQKMNQDGFFENATVHCGSAQNICVLKYELLDTHHPECTALKITLTARSTIPSLEGEVCLSTNLSPSVSETFRRRHVLGFKQ